MGDSTGLKSKSMPSWQLPQSSTISTEPEKEMHDLSDKSATTYRALLLEKASKFLEDKEIRAASKERKSKFLRAKGLNEEDINELLARESEVAQTSGIQNHGSDDETRYKRKGNSIVEETDDAVDPTPSLNANIIDDYVDSEPPPSAKGERPPIITYPEFLLQSKKPPPLITTDRVLSAFYLASGTAAALYGFSKYLMEPMVESLTVARHSFFENASSNIVKLNEQLESTVSNIPDNMDYVGEKDGSDSDSLSSDPARFFSRTIATQTSPHLSRSTSSASVNEKPSSSTAAIHADQMSKMLDFLSELNQEESDAPDPVKENFRLLTEYLHDLPMLGRTGQFQTAKQAGQKPEQRIDGVSRVKTEIKSVKGVLLSARNFPAGIPSR